MRRLKFRWAVVAAIVLLTATLLTATLLAQPFSTEIQVAINQLVTGVVPFTALRSAASSYLNWGTTQGTSGYGLRDSAGTIQVKNSGGSWANIVTGASLPTGAPFVTRTPDATLTNETALSALGTGLIINTTATGVPTIYAGGACVNQFPRSLSASGALTCAAVNLAVDVSGTLPVTAGGTGIAIGTIGGVLYFNATTTTIASSAQLALSQIVLGGGTGAPSTLGTTGSATTVLHGNAGGAPTFAAVDLTTTVTGILAGFNGGTGTEFFAVAPGLTFYRNYTFPDADAVILTNQTTVTAAQGGTGIASYAVGDLITATGVTTLTRLADIAVGNALLSGGVGVVPSWGKIGLTTHVTGTLPVTNGGTSFTGYTLGDLIYANGAASLAKLAIGAAGAFVRVNAGIPAWSALILPNAAVQGQVMVANAANTASMLAVGTAGQFLRTGGAGVNVAWSTIVLPNSAAVGDLLQATVANTYTNLASVATGNALISGGVTTASSWGKIGLTTHVSGTLAAGNGGLGITTTTDDATIVGSGAAWVSTAIPNAANGLAYSTAGNSFSAVTAPTYTALTFGVLAFSATAPTVNSGFGAGATIPNNNGTAAFTINVGTGGAATTGVLTLPAATVGWVCHVTNRTAVAANRADQHTVQTATTTTTATVQNQTVSTGAVLAWTASDILALQCTAY